MSDDDRTPFFAAIADASADIASRSNALAATAVAEAVALRKIVSDLTRDRDGALRAVAASGAEQSLALVKERDEAAASAAKAEKVLAATIKALRDGFCRGERTIAMSEAWDELMPYWSLVPLNDQERRAFAR